MKSIKNLRDLEYEKLKLRIKQLELEKQMERSWREITKKLTVRENAFKKEQAHSNVHFKTSNTILNGALNYGASFLSHKLGMLAGKKIEGLAEQVLENLSGKISAATSRRKKA